MRKTFLIAAVLAAAAFYTPSTAADPVATPPTFTCDLSQQGTVTCWSDELGKGLRCVIFQTDSLEGAGCGVLGASCTQAEWGIHEDEFVVGGYQGCEVLVWIDDDSTSCTATAEWPPRGFSCHVLGAGLDCTIGYDGVSPVRMECTPSTPDAGDDLSRIIQT